MQRSDGLRSKLRAGVGASESENLNANQTTNQISRCRFLRAEGLALNRNKFLRCLPQDCRGQVPASPGVEDFPIDVDGANFLFRDRCSACDLSIAGESSSHLRLERLDSDPGDPQGILNVTATDLALNSKAQPHEQDLHHFIPKYVARNQVLPNGSAIVAVRSP
jgi:hypothetical protein